MFDMFMRSHGSPQEDRPFLCYGKKLGWSEFDEDGDKLQVSILVCDVKYGYSVYQQDGQGLSHLFWAQKNDEAVEWAVDYARKRISQHEIENVKKE